MNAVVTPPPESRFEPADWHILARYWYPIALSDAVGEATHKAMPLDEPQVAYRVNGSLVVARDVCPHRGAPLTIGRHDGQGVVCRYHGLRFGVEGRCNLIPSSPNGPIPEKFKLVTYAHAETIGDPDNVEVPLYGSKLTPKGFQADYRSTVGNYPIGADGRAPADFEWLRHFEAHLPFTATLTIHFPNQARQVVMNAACPVSTRRTQLFAPIARNFDKHIPVSEVHAFNLRIFEEDRLVVETQKPERLSLDPTLEAHITADRSSIAYRRGLKRMGLGQFFQV